LYIIKNMTILTIWVHDRFAGNTTVNVIKPDKLSILLDETLEPALKRLTVTNIFTNFSKYFKY